MLNHDQNLFLVVWRVCKSFWKASLTRRSISFAYCSACTSFRFQLSTNVDKDFFRSLFSCWDATTIFIYAKTLLTSVCFFHIVKLYTAKINSKTRDIIWVRCNLRLIFTDCTIHASAAALIHRQQTLYWLFTQTKLNTDINLLSLIHVLGLDETWREALLTI